MIKMNLRKMIKVSTKVFSVKIILLTILKNKPANLFKKILVRNSIKATKTAKKLINKNNLN